jgi:3-oxoacyl-[acyl-carrier-protein] synthase-3
VLACNLFSLESVAVRDFLLQKAILNRVATPAARAADHSSCDGTGISALGYYLPPQERTIAELIASGQTNSSGDKLAQLGFGSIRVARDESAVQLAIQAVRDLQVRSGFNLDQVDVLLYAGALATSSVVIHDNADAWNTLVDPTPLFRFPGTCLQSELGVPRASVIGVAQLACNTFQATLRVARGLLMAERSLKHVLCVAADRFPQGCKREIVYNLMSDGACAAVVSREHPENRILSTVQITRGVYWDSSISHDQLIAAYFPLARRAILEAVASAGLSMGEIDLLIPHNLNIKSWEILAQVIGMPLEQIYTANIARIGHVVASDNIINYIDAFTQGRILRGQKIALFVMGFGAHWSCTVIEV